MDENVNETFLLWRMKSRSGNIEPFFVLLRLPCPKIIARFRVVWYLSSWSWSSMTRPLSRILQSFVDIFDHLLSFFLKRELLELIRLVAGAHKIAFLGILIKWIFHDWKFLLYIDILLETSTSCTSNSLFHLTTLFLYLILVISCCNLILKMCMNYSSPAQCMIHLSYFSLHLIPFFFLCITNH